MRNKIFLLVTISIFSSALFSQEKPMKQWTQEEYEQWEKKFYAPRSSSWSFRKVTAGVDRKASGIVRGNRIEARVSNFGSIGAPRSAPSVVWPKGSGISMGYEFAPIAGAEVVDKNGKIINILSDALIDGGERQNPSTATGNVMGWEPLPGYAAGNPNKSIAISTKPETWPDAWKTVGWPGRFGQGVITADEESYSVMDDRFNDEFEYYPLVNGADTIRGLGLQLSFRTYQFASNSAQDILLILYELKLRSDCKAIAKTVVGMVGDPHVGGTSDYADDYAGFNKDLNLVYAFDKPGSSNDYGVSNVGYLGFLFVKPQVPDSADWLPLTGFNAPIYGSVSASNDERMWQFLTPNLGPNDPPPIIEQNSDNLFVFSSGYFSLQPGQTQKFAIAIAMGNDLNNLIQNAKAVTQIAKANFKAPRPPELPTVKVIPNDKKVTLLWDGLKSENTIDPFLGVKDFEGYRIYRSDNKGLTWGKPITDNRGNQSLWEPIAIFDINNEFYGTHPVQSAPGVHMFLGNNSGLQYTFVDSSLELKNGITYYYAVSAFDHGDPSINLEPLETPLNIDAINVAKVVPNARPVDFLDAKIDSITHIAGFGTGKINLKVLDPFNVKAATYDIHINSFPKGFYVINSKGDTLITNSGSLLNTALNKERSYIFESLEMSVEDAGLIKPIDSLTRWVSGNSNLRVLPYWFRGAADYPSVIRIVFSDVYVDTSVLFNPKPIKFKAYDITRDNISIPIIFFDKDTNNTWSEGDSIVFPISKTTFTSRWAFKFRNAVSGTTTLPTVGSVFEFNTTVPFNSTAQDKYRIYTTPASSKKTTLNNSSLLNNVKVVPDPYVAASRFEQKSVYRSGRGERVIKFINLPVQCTIRVYTVAGEHVATIDHAGDLISGSEQSWNLLNKDGLDIAPGLYIYHLDAPGIGEKIGRFAIIK